MTAKHSAAADPVRLAHHLGNSISALKLRLEQVSADTTCMWAQGENLTAMARLLDETMNSVDKLEELLRAPPAAPLPVANRPRSRRG